MSSTTTSTATTTKQSPSSDSIAAGYIHRDEWLKSTPLPVVQPIYNTSIYFLPSVAAGEALISETQPGYFYARFGNPTTDACADVIAQLEGAEGGTLLTTSGMAAISLVMLTFLKSGDHLVCQFPIYAGAIKVVEDILTGNNVEVTWVDSNESVEAFEKAIKPNTKMVYIETPCNPKMSILDLESFGKLAEHHPQLVTVVDGTFGSVYVQQPLKYGVHISLHSCTKYIGGHSDITAGCLSFCNKELYKKAHWYLVLLGSSLVEAVFYPGLESHPHHTIAKKQMKHFSGMISFEVVGGKEAGSKLVEGVKLISLAVSLGGTGSLIEHPASMTNSGVLMDEEGRKKGGITDGLIRLSVGLEDVNDLISDLTQAMEHL
ncbi:L-methionine gamma-lyase-like isoform X2 [Dysidea avara]|uniref:L-methionine gamma-lyase-like isoform X2 n=1 Tax=Dysidea avara TaxID=196820 RepID=UPI0033324872